MDLFEKLKSAQGITMLGGLAVRAGEPVGDVRSFAVTWVQPDRPVRSSDRVLLTMHYYSHVLSRYPRDGALDRFGMELRGMMARVIEEGIWPGSNLLQDARVGDRVRVVPDGALDGGQSVHAVLFRTLTADDLDLALEIPDSMVPTDLNLSVVAVFQAMVDSLDEPGIELLTSLCATSGLSSAKELTTPARLRPAALPTRRSARQAAKRCRGYPDSAPLPA